MNPGELITDCLERLRAALPPGTSLEMRPGGRPQDGREEDGDLCLAGPWGQVTVRYEAKGHVGEANVDLVDRRMRAMDGGRRTDAPAWILLTDYVPGVQAHRLRERGVAFADRRGNVHVWGPGLYVWVTGNRPTARATRGPGLMRAGAARVLFVLLQDPRRARDPYRELAAQAGVAPDTVHRVFHDLEAKGHLKTMADRERILARLPELHERWITAYEDALRPKLLPKRCHRLKGGQVEDLRLALVDGGSVAVGLLGGEAAAAELTQTLRPTTATIHVDPGEQHTVMQALGLVPAPDGPIILLNRFGTMNEWQETGGRAVRLADPLLIHAELLRIGDDRARTAAAEIYERFIRPRFEP